MQTKLTWQSILIITSLSISTANAQEFIYADGIKLPREVLCTTAKGDIPCTQAKLTKWGKLCVPITQTNSMLFGCISQKAGVSTEKAKGMVWEQK